MADPVAIVPTSASTETPTKSEPVASRPPPSNTAEASDTTESSNAWATLPEDHSLAEFYALLPSLCDKAEHSEIWGVTLSSTAAQPIPVPTGNILQKYLRANQGDLDKAAAQLLATLQWRKEFNPRSAAWNEVHDENKFGGLGYISVGDTALNVDEVKEGEVKKVKDIVCWNVYGAVKDSEATFVPVEE